MVSASDEGTAAMLRVLDPDPDRAAEKYMELFHSLRRFFRRRDQLAAEDLAMETLRRGLSRIRSGAVIYVKPASYFFKIAENVAIEQWRSAPPPSTPIEDDIPDVRMVDFAGVDAGIYLDQCLRLLNDQEREVLVRYQNEDHAELARALGLSDVNLRVIAHRARIKLMRLMKRAGASGADATKPPGRP